MPNFYAANSRAQYYDVVGRNFSYIRGQLSAVLAYSNNNPTQLVNEPLGGVHTYLGTIIDDEHIRLSRYQSDTLIEPPSYLGALLVDGNVIWVNNTSPLP